MIAGKKNNFCDINHDLGCVFCVVTEAQRMFAAAASAPAAAAVC